MWNLCRHSLIRITIALLIGFCVGCQPLGVPVTEPSPPSPDQVFVVTSLSPSNPANTTPKPGPISGLITDNNGNPIANAGVKVEVLTPGVPLAQIGYASDPNGYYNLLVLFPADYRITISAERYISETKLVTVKEGQFLTLNFALQPSK
jgi:hypothetical protein